ncbi:MAG: efflux RND transporter periplasmic adaptor subunit [Hyphomonas sp.]|nr:efflux RND transporter periplasmic adaptor subunit [Hyphomonas sp.]MCB9961735.1 efflux RND transporter periplasmic adaptor subunit [Hyphomonas sp.]MCB9972770.1 efflux RND transporter periplasmic adaptor subunit [Hyphomonas sp.]MCC0017465.1 efflux RND transporter periplasmic adaptor subunit [Rhodobiaceae bacterium]
MFRSWHAATMAALAALALVAVPQAEAQRGPGAASVFVEPVGETEFSMHIEAIGTLEARERVDLTLNVADRVTAIYFDDGDRVTKGKTLLSLAQGEQAALVDAAEATANEARQRFERTQQLAAERTVAQSALDEAQRDLNAANAQLRAVQSRQKDRVLVAPFDGVLGFRMVSVGSYVKAGDVVAELIDDSQMKLDFSVPSTFLRSAKKGTRITAETDDLPGVVFEGEVETVGATIDPVTRSIRVRAILPNEDRLMKPGMFMKVTLLANPRQSLSVPETAIEPIGPDSFVYVAVKKGDQLVAERRKVDVGLRQKGRVEVVSGLEAGDTIVSDGLIRVRDGAPIVVRDRGILNSGTAAGPGMVNAQ